jgi:exosortase/archaeosortase family protein
LDSFLKNLAGVRLLSLSQKGMLLLLGGVGVWLCLSVLSLPEGRDTVLGALLAGGIVLFFHLPVHWRDESTSGKPPTQTAPWIYSSLLILIGGMAGLLVVQALGWAWAVKLWSERVLKGSALPLSRAWLLWFFVIPWIAHDFSLIGWWFRLSGSIVSEWVFSALGYPVFREGTNLLVGGLPVSVEAACAGLGLLQSLLVTGLLVLLILFPRGKSFWFLLPGIPLLAWMANTFRILLVTAVAMSQGVEFAQGVFHTWGGLLALLLMVLLSLPFLLALRRSFFLRSASKE